MDVLLAMFGMFIPDVMAPPPMPTPAAYSRMLAESDLLAETGTPMLSEDSEHLRALQWLAEREELMDSRERGYVCRFAAQSEIDFLRNRRIRLAQAPSLAECRAYPATQEEAVRAIQFNRAYKAHLELRQLWEPDRAELIRQAINETDTCYQAWSCVRDMKIPSCYLTVQRQAALELSRLIGAESFRRGELPPVVPYWRFRD